MKISHLGLAFAAIMLLLLACNLTGGLSQSPTQTAPAPTASPNAIASRLVDEQGEPADPETPPADFVQSLLAEVNNGQISREQAVLTGLKLMANELDGDQIFEEKSVSGDSGWGMTVIARQLYQQSDDPGLKAELERLMAILAPAQENLNAYSQRADAAGYRLPGLASVRSPRQDAESCRDLRDSGFPTDRGSFPICLLYSEETIGSSTLRVYYPFELGDDPSYMTFVNSAVEALRDSHAAYSPMLDLRDINLIMTLEPAEAPFSRVFAAVPGLGPEDLERACPISVYPRALELSIPFFKQALAHEVFHCAHFWRRSSTGYEGTAWYAEGMATHFSNVVYPEINLEHSFFRLYFDVTSVDRPLPEMDYQSYIFFQYLENRFGNEYNINLLDTLPDGGGSDTQAAALSSYDDMEEIFHDFGKAYLAKQINDTSGDPIPVRLFFETAHTYEVGEELRFSRDSDSFTLTRTRVKFDECGQFDILSELSTDQGKHSWKDVDQTTFIEVPNEQTVNCEGLDFWHLLTTTADSIRLDVEIELTEEGRCDCCIIGTWEQTNSEIRTNLQQVMSGFGTVQSVSGRFVLSVFRDGSMVLFPEDYTARVQVDDELIVGEVVGSAVSYYTLPNEDQIQSTTGPTGFIVTLTTEDGSASFPFEPAAGMSSGGTFRYQCDDRSFTAFIPEGIAPFSSSTYQRLSEVPEEPEFEEVESPPEVEPPLEPDIAGSAEVCPRLSLSGFSPAGNTARWTLSNGSTEQVEITALSLDWPPGNGSLIRIQLGAATIWEGSLTAMGRITDGWSGELAARQLAAGASAPIDLVFSSDSLASTGYIHAVEFSNSCSAVDVR